MRFALLAACRCFVRPSPQNAQRRQSDVGVSAAGDVDEREPARQLAVLQARADVDDLLSGRS